MPFLFVILCVVATIVLFFASSLRGQTSGSQKFSITVAESTSVTVPPDVELAESVTDTDQDFPPQRYRVIGNTPAGVVVRFSTESPFVHVNDTSFRSDAGLSVFIAEVKGPANWVAVQAYDETDIAGLDETASVQVESDGVGTVSLDLTARFLVDPQTVLATGTYELTIASTVTVP